MNQYKLIHILTKHLSKPKKLALRY